MMHINLNVKLQRQLGVTVFILIGVESLQYDFISEAMPLTFFLAIISILVATTKLCCTYQYTIMRHILNIPQYYDNTKITGGIVRAHRRHRNSYKKKKNYSFII
jgi:hypothetical protein